MSKIGDLVRGNVSTLFGRFRPPAGMSGDEIAGVKAERIEFGQRLTSMLKLIDAPTDKITREVRDVFRELQNAAYTVKMPTPDGIAASVRERCDRGTLKPFCPACTELGGIPGIYVDTPVGTEILRGTHAVGKDWWCGPHVRVYVWYAHRQDRHADGIAWPYTPPEALIPQEAFRIGADPDSYADFTDGPLMGALALYVREYLESQIGEMLLDEPKILA